VLRTTEQIRTVALPSGELVPQLGLGTWHLGENPASRAEEIATLRLALDLGVTLIDTAEMYGEGLAESLIGEAISDRRDEFFLVTKVYPHNASHRAMPVACERSLRRLRTDRIDLYLLHWRGSIPLSETVETFMALQRAEYIRNWGISNFDSTIWSSCGRCLAGVTSPQIRSCTILRGAVLSGI
jgi:aryl-alcohol dehydrogenase-like predicted oxidoreductase